MSEKEQSRLPLHSLYLILSCVLRYQQCRVVRQIAGSLPTFVVGMTKDMDHYESIRSTRAPLSQDLDRVFSEEKLHSCYQSNFLKSNARSEFAVG